MSQPIQVPPPERITRAVPMRLTLALRADLGTRLARAGDAIGVVKAELDAVKATFKGRQKLLEAEQVGLRDALKMHDGDLVQVNSACEGRYNQVTGKYDIYRVLDDGSAVFVVAEELPEHLEHLRQGNLPFPSGGGAPKDPIADVEFPPDDEEPEPVEPPKKQPKDRKKPS